MTLITGRWVVLAGVIGLAGCAGTAPLSPQTGNWLAGPYVEADPAQRQDLDIDRWRAVWRDPEPRTAVRADAAPSPASE